jgi:hypothetical protein
MSKSTPRPSSSRFAEEAPITETDRDIFLAQAASPDTSPTQLEQLTKLNDEAINTLIAANPNTPERTLHRLWCKHPLRALENPIVWFWSLREGKPLRELLSMDVKIALYIALRKSGSLETLEEHLPARERCGWLSPNHYHGFFESAAETVADSLKIERLREGTKASLKRSLASAQSFLATDPSDAVRACLADAIDKLPLETRSRNFLQSGLARDPSTKVRRAVASSQRIHGELHTQLSTDPEIEVRRALARNPSRHSGASVESWNSLIAAGHAAEVAANPACPESVKINLVCFGSAQARSSAWLGIRFHELTNRRPISELIDRIFEDPERVLELVQLGKNQTIGGTLKSRLIAHPDVRVTRSVATQRHLTEEQRMRLLFHSDSKTALRAAKHAPAADYLDAVAGHSNPLVRALLAAKEGETLWSLRTKLLEDPDPRVRAALCWGLRAGVEDYATSRPLHAAVIRRFLVDPCPRVREAAARHPQFGIRGLRRR